MKASLSDLDPARVSGEGSSASVIEQLKRIQDSHSFCNSPRSKEFLSYVVQHGLEGREELLKERSIGVNVFQRSPSYITSEDPIVRVKAAEVRRRLAQYYAEESEPSEVRIEIPVGSYMPRFRWRQPASPAPPTATSTQADPAPAMEPEPQPLPGTKFSRRWTIAGITAGLIFAGIAGAVLIRAHEHRSPTLDRFWGPLSATPQPVLICVPSPVSYAVSSDLFQQSPLAQSGAYNTVAKRNTTPLQLDPDTLIKWKEITPLADFYVNKDDAYAAEGLASFFVKMNRPTQIRFGSDYTYEDLRSSPAILVGAYNNPWMDRVMSDLPIGFRESGEVLWIEDRTKPGHVWKASSDGRLGNKDFALIARLLNAKTGQFLIILSGVGMVGTKAAGALISDEQALHAALRRAPDGWETKNMEVVLETDIVAGSPSPPHTVAVNVW